MRFCIGFSAMQKEMWEYKKSNQEMHKCKWDLVLAGCEAQCKKNVRIQKCKNKCENLIKKCVNVNEI